MNDLAVEIEAAIREVISTPGLTSSDLIARLEALLPGTEPVVSSVHGGGGWAEDVRSIGRPGVGVRTGFGAPYGSMSSWRIVTAEGWTADQWPPSGAENERLFRLIPLAMYCAWRTPAQNPTVARRRPS